ncbi:virulence factor, partial [Streptomyces sp. SID11233]|nr:virulence factor [Streptomyces sp. SID11233]
NSADAAELDAASARGAATAAETDAAAARGVADQAERDATAAEASAARAQELAREAQEAATRTENAAERETVTTGGATGIGQMFTKQKVEQLGDPVPQNDCVLDIGFDGCTVKYKLRFNVTIDFYLCADEDAGADVSAATCPVDSIVWLGSEMHENQTAYIDKYFSRLEITMIFDKMVLQTLWHMLVDDFVECAKGSVSGCLWAASNFIPGKKIAEAVDAVRALDAAMKTGIGVGDAYKVLKNVDLDPQVLAAIEREVNVIEDALTACRANSFPAGTQVRMADGSYRSVDAVRVGERVLASDPVSGALASMPVTDTFQHDTERLVDLTMADGSTLSSTAGHKFFVIDRGWTLTSDLAVGDRLRDAQGTGRAVEAVRDRSGLEPRAVYDLTVGGLHTFFVRTQGARAQDVLVHNCTNIIADEGIEGAHTLEDHVLSDAAAWDRAQLKGKATKWTDEATAARAVSEAFVQWAQAPGNAAVLAKWVSKQAQKRGSGAIFNPVVDLKGLRWELRNEGSLGKVFTKGGARDGVATGSTVVIQLKYVKNHPKKYVVYTSYPE